MSSIIAAAPAATLAPSGTAMPPAPAATASRGQQQATLTRMLAKYSYDQSRGGDPAALSSLGKQITAAAKALGQHVTLPRAPASAAPETGKVNVTA
ncbi:MAG TPA: hypothetical protein VHT74_14485 [Acetobacteraceae bacterium]|jgi:hypothetical protein|nr:hypothetical protein [Acetobacteraceae bacterium]